MRKVLVIALREYNAAVRTRAFLIGLLMMPLMMGGSVLAQWLLQKYRDTSEKRFAVVDATPGAKLLPVLQKAVASHNQQTTDPKTAKRIGPPFAIEEIPASANANEQRHDLSERVRKGELAGFLEIGPDAARLKPPAEPSRGAILFRTSRVTEQDFATLARVALAPAIHQLRCQEAGLPTDKVELAVRPVAVEARGLLKRDDPSGEAQESNRFAGVLVPALLMILMFMLVLMSATPLMQGVVEEKMQRIAEVLLGSVSPFQLMLGKLLGMAAVSLTIAAVYLGGAYWGMHHYGMAEYAPWSLLVWFILFQTLAALMYGSLFIAVGAACTDMRETQNLLWPVMLLASLPMFVLGSVLREPNSGVVTGMSLFPFFSPMLLIARMAVPPGVPVWQPIVGIVGMVAMTLLCVWAAGRIFRVGILLMGKGASPMQLMHWIIRG